MSKKILFAVLGVFLACAVSCERLEENPEVSALYEGMALIPGGEFVMGEEDGEDNPAHTVYIDPFYMDVHEVTNSEYKVFCDSTDRKLP